jgi:hypothetical protein
MIKCTDRRKNWLSMNKTSYVDVNENRVSYQDLINKEPFIFLFMIIYEYSSLCDGLKPSSQRKII